MHWYCPSAFATVYAYNMAHNWSDSPRNGAAQDSTNKPAIYFKSSRGSAFEVLRYRPKIQQACCCKKRKRNISIALELIILVPSLCFFRKDQMKWKFDSLQKVRLEHQWRSGILRSKRTRVLLEIFCICLITVHLSIERSLKPLALCSLSKWHQITNISVIPYKRPNTL